MSADGDEYEPTLGALDNARQWIAGGLLALVFVEVVGIIVLFAVGRLDTGSLGEVATAILSPVVGLVGTAIGFYFGKPTES